MSKVKQEGSSLREKPEPVRPRRLADWINPEGERKVHSLVDKIYSKTNLALAWERVRAGAEVSTAKALQTLQWQQMSNWSDCTKNSKKSDINLERYVNSSFPRPDNRESSVH
jgi:hypothetical protein